MRKIVTRVLFGLWIVGAPMLFVGCGEEPKKDAAPPAATTPPEKGKLFADYRSLNRRRLDTRPRPELLGAGFFIALTRFLMLRNSGCWEAP